MPASACQPRWCYCNDLIIKSVPKRIHRQARGEMRILNPLLLHASSPEHKPLRMRRPLSPRQPHSPQPPPPSAKPFSDIPHARDRRWLSAASCRRAGDSPRGKAAARCSGGRPLGACSWTARKPRHAAAGSGRSADGQVQGGRKNAPCELRCVAVAPIGCQMVCVLPSQAPTRRSRHDAGQCRAATNSGSATLPWRTDGVAARQKMLQNTRQSPKLIYSGKPSGLCWQVLHGVSPVGLTNGRAGRGICMQGFRRHPRRQNLASSGSGCDSNWRQTRPDRHASESARPYAHDWVTMASTQASSPASAARSGVQPGCRLCAGPDLSPAGGRWTGRAVFGHSLAPPKVRWLVKSIGYI